MKRLRKASKGYWGDRKNHLRQSSNTVLHALAFAYRGRKEKKRDFRKLWIMRLSAAAKMNGISYSKFIFGLKRANCDLDRKILSEMALNDPQNFSLIVNRAKEALLVS
jgi:large subunit ribosomal protein L20